MSIVDAVLYGASLLLKAGVIVLAGWLLAAALRTRSAAMRHVVWCGGLAAILLLPILTVLTPPVDISAFIPTRAAPEVSAEVPTGNGVADVTVAADGMAHESSAIAATSRVVKTAAGNRSFAALLLVVWALGAGLLLTRLAIHMRRAKQLEAAAKPARYLTSAAASVARRLGLSRTPSVRIGGVASPAVRGFARPVVLLPSGAASWTDSRLDAVLTHELAHIRRADYAAHFLAEIACVLYWPNPLVWFARHRLEVEQERACDDAVLRSGTPPYVYAEALLDITTSVQAVPAFQAGLRMARPSGLKDRIRAILDPSVERGSMTPPAVAAVLIAVLLPALSAASLQTGISEPAAFMILEAEDAALVHPMVIRDDKRASGGRFVLVPDGDGNDPPDGGPGAVSFRFEVEREAVYTVWARVIGDHHNDNSFFVSIDDGEEKRWDIVDPNDADDDVEQWTWLDVTRVRLAAGAHAIRFGNREDGSRLDAVFVTTDPDLVPRGRSPLPLPAQPYSTAFEAEHPVEITEPLEIHEGDHASGGRYISAEDGPDGRDRVPLQGRATYRFDVPATGQYVVWGRVEASDGRSDSFWVRANDASWVRWNGIDARGDWSWQLVHDTDDGDEVARFGLQKGSNTLQVAYREDGARLDRLYVTNDPHANPSNVTVIFRD